MHNFKELKVWRESMALAKAVFVQTGTFPTEEKFGLVSQMRRCAVSIASNIAEGAGRSSDREYARFLEIAIGSGFELETQALLASDFGYLHSEALASLMERITLVQRLLNGFRKSLDRKEQPER